MEIQYVDYLPSKDDFYSLFETTGWNVNGTYSKDALERALCHSWYYISAYHEHELVGFGRIISDGVYQTFIGDLIVRPDFQRKGIGNNILNLLVEKCKESGIKWIQLTCAKGKVNFYKKYGFEERPADGPGMQRYL